MEWYGVNCGYFHHFPASHGWRLFQSTSPFCFVRIRVRLVEKQNSERCHTHERLFQKIGSVVLCTGTAKGMMLRKCSSIVRHVETGSRNIGAVFGRKFSRRFFPHCRMRGQEFSHISPFANIMPPSFTRTCAQNIFFMQH